DDFPFGRCQDAPPVQVVRHLVRELFAAKDDGGGRQVGALFTAGGQHTNGEEEAKNSRSKHQKIPVRRYLVRVTQCACQWQPYWDAGRRSVLPRISNLKPSSFSDYAER